MSSPVLVTLGKEAIDAIVRIEESVDYPTWNRRLISGEFTNSFSTVFGARNGGELVGYLIVHTVLDEVHIVNLAVARHARRQGIARFILRTVLEDLFWSGSRKAYLEVRVSNTGARCLYDSFGFDQIAIRKSYYSNNQEDALVLQVDLQNFYDEYCSIDSRVANE